MRSSEDDEGTVLVKELGSDMWTAYIPKDDLVPDGSGELFEAVVWNGEKFERRHDDEVD